MMNIKRRNRADAHFNQSIQKLAFCQGPIVRIALVTLLIFIPLFTVTVSLIVSSGNNHILPSNIKDNFSNSKHNNPCSKPVTDPDNAEGNKTMSNMDVSCDVANIAPFAFRMFSLLASTPTEYLTDESAIVAANNILISPFSIAALLALILAGTTPSSTAHSEILSLLSISSHTDVPNLSNLLISSRTRSLDESDASSFNGGVELLSTNSIWIKKSQEIGGIRPDYIQTVNKIHSAGAFPLPQTYEPIDEYISDGTNGLIKDVLSGEIDPQTVAVLVNAIYFKGAWKRRFNPQLTKTGMFTSLARAARDTATGTQKEVQFMNLKEKLEIATNLRELGGATIVKLDYAPKEGLDNDPDKNDSTLAEADFCALFILPAENTVESMNNLISSLAKTSGTNIKSSNKSSNPMTQLQSLLENNLTQELTSLTLPKFKLSYGVESLKPLLQSMGLISPFVPNESSPPFPLMTDDPRVYLDDVLHKAVMEVSEEGTVAAAATVGIMMTRSLPPEPIVIDFNRPFVTVVMHSGTFTPVFVGRVDDVSSS